MDLARVCVCEQSGLTLPLWVVSGQAIFLPACSETNCQMPPLTLAGRLLRDCPHYVDCRQYCSMSERKKNLLGQNSTFDGVTINVIDILQRMFNVPWITPAASNRLCKENRLALILDKESSLPDVWIKIINSSQLPRQFCQRGGIHCPISESPKTWPLAQNSEPFLSNLLWWTAPCLWYCHL